MLASRAGEPAGGCLFGTSGWERGVRTCLGGVTWLTKQLAWHCWCANGRVWVFMRQQRRTDLNSVTNFQQAVGRMLVCMLPQLCI